MSHTSAATKRRRDNADACYYCHQALTHNIPPHLGTDATIEHLHSRNEFPDGRPQADDAIVIACKDCNEWRGALEERRVGVARLRELAGRWPREYEDAASIARATDASLGAVRGRA